MNDRKKKKTPARRSRPASGAAAGALLIQNDPSLFTALINQSNDAIFIVDPETAAILYVNDKARSNLGYPGDVLLGMKIHEFAANVKSDQEWTAWVGRVKAAGSAFIETEQRRKDGSRLPVEVNVRFVTLAGGEFMISVARDITERKQAEKSLREERNKLEAVMSAIGDGITVQDREFRILYQNAPHREKQGDHAGEFCYRAYQHRDQICKGCLLVTCFADGRVHRRETSAVTEQGTLHMEVSASPLRDAEGRIVGGIEVVRDITERKSLEEQLLHAQKMEAVGQLASGVAHDFNNVLTAIIGYANLLQMEAKDGGPGRPYIDQVLASAERASKLTRSLLTFSRKQTMQMKALDLNGIVRGIDKLLRPLMGEDIELRTVLAASALTVMADSGQIEQVLMNLASNARDAMPQGGRVTIKTSLADIDPDEAGGQRGGRSVLLSVTDTGTGMDKETQKRIFDPFFTTKEQGRGTGLGLAMAYGIVRQHQGTIQVSSKPGSGTTFTIALPYHAAAPNPERPAVAPLPGGNETVLLVEDEAVVRRLLKLVLEYAGYAVVEAADGEEGFARFLEHQGVIRLVLTDVIMPKKNGRELYESISAVRPGIKALFMSGYSAEIMQSRGIPDQGTHYLPKPVAPDTLLRKIRTMLD
ncbi:MAG: hypothetical protein A2010_02580, partial [Nitrospirae bacterium GWD2_57_9]